MEKEIFDLLDRKFNFLMNTENKNFMIDLSDFMFFISEDTFIKDYTEKIYYDLLNKKESYKKEGENEINLLKKLAYRILKKYPELDDRKTKFDKSTQNFKYLISFVAFYDYIDNKLKDTAIPFDPDPMEDRSVQKKLLGIIYQKIKKYEENEQHEKIREIDNTILVDYNNLSELHEYNFKKWINYLRVSPGAALSEIISIVYKINPLPKNHKNVDEMIKNRISQESFSDILHYRWIEDLSYGVISKYSNYRPSNLSEENITKIISTLKCQVKRVYENLRHEIGSSKVRHQILNKYKTRCMCYDDLSTLINYKEKSNNKLEEKLTKHLTCYLFDNGISSIYKLRLGKHELDVVDPNAHKPMLIEVKIYKKPAKSYLVKGIYQLHAYLNNISSQININEAYFIIYRIGGTLYEFPPKIKTEQFIINILIIDVARSNISGSKQPKPVIISENEILKNINNKKKE